MKSYLFSFLICFVSTNMCLAHYSTDEQQLACLFGNGLNNSTDIELLDKFVHSDSKDQTEFHLERQFACAIACVLNSGQRAPRRAPQNSIYQQLTDIIEYDDRIPGEQKRGMKYILDRCHQNDEGDDCELLNCIRILRSPFKETLTSLD